MMRMGKLSTMFLALAGLLLLWGQPAQALTNISAQATYDALVANPNAVMFDTRSVDEYYGCQVPWLGDGCTDSVDALRGTPMWEVNVTNALGQPITRLPFNIPYWNTGNQGTGAPEEWAEVRAMIGALLESGAITHSTPIYLLCRTAYRSFYMGRWMEGTTFAPGSGRASDPGAAAFTNLYNIDADAVANTTNAGNGTGGMKEWKTIANLPVWAGAARMPPIVISNTPANLATFDVSDVNFRITILEPTVGANGAIGTSANATRPGHAPLVRTCVNYANPSLQVFEACDYTDTPAGTAVNHFDFTITLTDGDWGWNSYAENTTSAGNQEIWGPNATNWGLDNRQVTVTTATCTDNDGDGFCAETDDCNDNDALQFPGQTWYADADGDGYSSGAIIVDCARPSGYYVAAELTATSGDCNDNNAAINPAASDSTCNGIDDNCDGTADDGYVAPSTTCGIGVCAATGTLECVNGSTADNCVEGTPGTEGPVGDATCSDSLDNDCDGSTDLADSNCVGVCTDNDGDGYCAETDDCDDNNSAINPGASDSLCDGVDNNCDGVADDGYAATDTTCGVGECASTGSTTCVGGSEGDTCTPGTAAADDATCNGLDDDCDGVADEDYAASDTTCGVGECASTGTLECANGSEVDSCVEGTPSTEGPVGDATCSDNLDNDCDGTTDLADSSCVLTCTDKDEDGYAVEGGACGEVDCNDSNAKVNPGATEVCDGVDNNCDGSVDEGFDADGDGYTTCGGDCDDSNSAVNLGATEGPAGDPTCSDGLDNDCDSAIDGADSGCVEVTEPPPTRRRRGRRMGR